uniref:CCZ1/INTU/HSP4 first Longin domain-containing protein n=1 Tax=Globodera rostochiensis TaxID=31243 RepID=A0A914HH84_GLORO
MWCSCHDLLHDQQFFFIFKWQKEGSEHKRIMFFHPTEETISKQIEVTGMSEAIVNFTNGINSMDCGKDDATSCDFDFRYITSTNSKEIVLVVEKGNFLIGTSFNKKLCTARDYFPHLPTICSLLTNAYNAYKLLYGLLSSRFHTNSSEFKGTLDRFFTPFLHLYRVNKIPLIDLFNGVDFLSVDNLNFLEIDCLIANCIQEFPCIKKGMFFYQERLVQYSVSKKDLAALCQFVVQTLIPSAVQNEVCPPPSAANRS